MHGFIVIDKAAGMTSAEVVRRVKRQLPKGTKIGHTGTLDPNVTGVLALALGRATKVVNYLNDEKKIYRCTLRFGLKTDSADIWGNVVERREGEPFTLSTIADALQRLTGKIAQTPPMFSAVKKDGKRLYQLARDGQVVDRPAKSVEIFSYDDVVYNFPDLSFTVSCSRGTYVRTLCEDIAAQIGGIATMTALQRLRSGPFDLAEAHGLEQFSAQSLAQNLLPVDWAFQRLATISVDGAHARHLLHGVKVDLRRFCSDLTAAPDDLFRVYYKTLFLGIARRKAMRIAFEKAFCDIATLEEYL